jgi:hypothetical protein
LRTIQDFIEGEFRLGNLKELSLLSGFKFQDFSASRQRKIKNRSIRGIVMSERTHKDSRFEIFERINTSSKVANPSEVRRGALRGPFLDLVIELSDNELFKRLAPTPGKAVKERKREELVTRFFAYGDGLDDYKDNVKEFIFNYTEKMNSEFLSKPSQSNKYEKRFMETMQYISAKFPLGFRKTSNGKFTPTARFESIAIGSYLALLKKPSIRKKNAHVEDWLDGKDFIEVTSSDAANVKSKLLNRINFVRDKLLEV